MKQSQKLLRRLRRQLAVRSHTNRHNRRNRPVRSTGVHTYIPSPDPSPPPSPTTAATVSPPPPPPSPPVAIHIHFPSPESTPPSSPMVTGDPPPPPPPPSTTLRSRRPRRPRLVRSKFPIFDLGPAATVAPPPAPLMTSATPPLAPEASPAATVAPPPAPLMTSATPPLAPEASPAATSATPPLAPREKPKEKFCSISHSFEIYRCLEEQIGWLRGERARLEIEKGDEWIKKISYVDAIIPIVQCEANKRWGVIERDVGHLTNHVISITTPHDMRTLVEVIDLLDEGEVVKYRLTVGCDKDGIEWVNKRSKLLLPTHPKEEVICSIVGKSSQRKLIFERKQQSGGEGSSSKQTDFAKEKRAGFRGVVKVSCFRRELECELLKLELEFDQLRLDIREGIGDVDRKKELVKMIAKQMRETDAEKKMQETLLRNLLKELHPNVHVIRDADDLRAIRAMVDCGTNGNVIHFRYSPLAQIRGVGDVGDANVTSRLPLPSLDGRTHVTIRVNNGSPHGYDEIKPEPNKD